MAARPLTAACTTIEPMAVMEYCSPIGKPIDISRSSSAFRGRRSSRDRRKMGYRLNRIARHSRPLIACDTTVAILAPTEARVRRLIAREGITEEYARARIAAQKTDDFYRKHCTCILENNGTREEYANHARTLFRSILEVN